MAQTERKQRTALEPSTKTPADDVKPSSRPPAISPDEESLPLSPYERRRKDYEMYKNQSEGDVAIFTVSKIFAKLPKPRLEQLGVTDTTRTSDIPLRVYQQLTQEEIEIYDHAMIVSSSIVQLQNRFYQELVDTEYKFLVVHGHFETVHHELQAVVHARASLVKDCGKQVFQHAYALVVACDRLMYRYEEGAILRIVPKLIPVLEELLILQDTELGFHDPYSRNGLLFVLDGMKWLGTDHAYKTKANGFGKGSAPPLIGFEGYLAAALPISRLEAASKLMQIVIRASWDSNRVVAVVVSASMKMKKFSELCAFVTAHTNVFTYKENAGTPIPGSRFELTHDKHTMWLGDKYTAVKAADYGAAWKLDEEVRLVQVFQGSGLRSGPESITFASSLAKVIGWTPGACTWNAPTGHRYNVTIHSIVPSKTHKEPLPRIVHPQPLDAHARTGFGLYVRPCNDYLRDDRKCPFYPSRTVRSAAENADIASVAAAQPL